MKISDDYYSRRLSTKFKVEPNTTKRVSFMGAQEESAYTRLLIERRREQNKTIINVKEIPGRQRSTETSSSIRESDTSSTLLDLVRSQRTKNKSHDDQSCEEIKDEHKKDNSAEVVDFCFHGYHMNPEKEANRERSVSRRTKMSFPPRDMDVQSILTYTSPYTSTKDNILRLSALAEASKSSEEKRVKKPDRTWSIRRSICPVCSQKWKDKSSITGVKNSGLKRNSNLSEMPSVLPPARLRASIKTEYTPRPLIATIDEETGPTLRALHSGTVPWKLFRARRIRNPETLIRPSTNTTTAAPVTTDQGVLDKRVDNFLRS